MALAPQAFERIPHQDFRAEKVTAAMPLSPKEFRQTFPDGRMMSNPGLAKTEHGEALLTRAVAAISEIVTSISNA